MRNEGLQIYNVKGKTPYFYTSETEGVNLTEKRRQSGEYSLRDPEQFGLGIWCGKQPNGQYIIGFDYDIHTKVNNEYVKNFQVLSLKEQQMKSIDFKGCFESSTKDHGVILCDISKCPDIIKKLETINLKKITGHNNGLEIICGMNLVLPPTQTACKVSGKKERPRKFLSKYILYEIQENDTLFNELNTICDSYISQFRINKEPPKTTDKPTPTPSPSPSDKKSITDLILELPNKYLQNYDTWFRIGLIMKQEGASLKDFIKISRTAKGYEDTLEEEYWEFWKSLHPKGNLTKSTIFYWIKKEKPKEFISIWQKYTIANQSDFHITETGVAELLLERYKDIFICCLKGGKEVLYNFNGNIWDNINSKHKVFNLISIIGRDLIKYCNNKITENEELSSYYFGMIKTISQFFSSHNHRTNVYKEFLIQLGFNTDITFDGATDVIHFKNGAIDLKTQTFRKRNITDYVSQTIPYDYEEPNPQDVSFLRNVFSQIVSNPEELEMFFRWLGYCITGDVSQHYIKFNVGNQGNNGKSFSHECMAYCFPLYTQKLDKKTFNLNNTTAHKSLIHLIDRPIRYAYMEELDQKQLDAGMLKTFTDGMMSVDRMYGTNETGTHQAKLNINSNYEPRIQSDGGIMRRCRVQQFTTIFYKKHQAMPEGGIRENPEILERIKKDNGFKCAFVKLLLPYASKFYKEGLILYKQWETNFEEIANAQDQWEDWIDRNFEITNEKEDYIPKSEIIELARDVKRNVNWIDIRNVFRRFNIWNYDKDKRINGVKGVIRFLKIRKQDSQCVPFLSSEF